MHGMSYGTVEQPKFASKLKLYCIWNLYAAVDCRIGNLKAEHLRWHQRLNYCNTEEIASRIGRFILVSFGWQATKTVEEVMIVCLSLWRRTINCQMPLYHSKPLLYSAADTPWQPLCVYLYICICAHVFVIVNMYLYMFTCVTLLYSGAKHLWQLLHSKLSSCYVHSCHNSCLGSPSIPSSPQTIQSQKAWLCHFNLELANNLKKALEVRNNRHSCASLTWSGSDAAESVFFDVALFWREKCALRSVNNQGQAEGLEKLFCPECFVTCCKPKSMIRKGKENAEIKTST